MLNAITAINMQLNIRAFTVTPLIDTKFVKIS
jgi:hypothetical protein